MSWDDLDGEIQGIFAEAAALGHERFIRVDGYHILYRGPSAWRRPRRTRGPYGLRHRDDCAARDGSRVVAHKGRPRRCLACVQASRTARASRSDQRHCAVCDCLFTPPANNPATCSKACRYRLSSTTRRAAGGVSPVCQRGHVKTKVRRDGSQECTVCKADRQRARRREGRTQP